MRAVVRTRYGPPDILELREVEKPPLADDGVLVRVHAASVNRSDWYELLGTPYVGRVSMGVRRPKEAGVGADFAGTVEAVGRDVTHVRPGDEVYGARTGAFAEYVSVKNALVRKPANVTFEEAAAVPVSGITALQGLRDKGQLQPGQKVLINGASGAVGTFAVQIAKALGGEVTAVCSTRNVEQAWSLGADRVIDYTKEDFTRDGGSYDLLLDIAGSRSCGEYARVLTPEATIVVVGAPIGNALVGPLSRIVRLRLGGLLQRRTVKFFIAKLNRRDLDTLRELQEAGKVRSVIEKRYTLDEAPEALRYMGRGHARAKLVIDVNA